MKDFAKVFSQIYDSSIVEHPEVRFTFMDFMILADWNGVVDMTHEAIARRTNRPIEVIRETIAELEKPDPRSRTPDLDGVRIVRLDEHRDWGWRILNFEKFRMRASAEQRREKTRERVRKHRAEKHLPECNADVTRSNAGNATKTETEIKTEIKNTSPNPSVGGEEEWIDKEMFIARWNAYAPSKIRNLSSGRVRHLHARWGEAFFRENHIAAIEKIPQSDFLMGRGDSKWKATIDWFLRPDTVSKIMEGAYDNKIKEFRL